MFFVEKAFFEIEKCCQCWEGFEVRIDGVTKVLKACNKIFIEILGLNFENGFKFKFLGKKI